MSKINTGYSLNECPPMKETILYSIQQIIVAVFNVIPVPLLIGAGIGLSPSEITILVAGCLLVTGIATILQTIGAGPVGARLPIVLECSFVFVAPGIALGSKYGLNVYTGACLVGSIITLILWTLFHKTLTKMFKPYITGSVVMVLGIRFHPVRSYHSVVSDVVPKEVVDTIDGVMNDAQRLVDTYHDRSEYSMCRVGIGPSIAQYETEEILKATVDFATSNDIMVHGHLAESRHEAEFTYEKFGCSPVKWFYNHDLLGERFYYAHCIHLDDEDIRIMADTKTGVSSCPVSNMYLSSGACRIKDLMSAGVERIGLGVDGPASSNSSNIMEEMRVSYLLNRLVYGDRPCSAEDILYMVTAGGAKVLGRDDIGILAPDKAADITLLNWKQLSYAGGCNDPVDCIVISGDARMVDTVICNGIKVVENHKLTQVDESKKRDYANKVGKELLTKASSRIPGLKADIE